MKIKSIIIVLLCLCVMFGCGKKKTAVEDASFVDYTKVKTPNFSADSAYYFVKKQCEFGPRTPMSKGAKECFDYLYTFFEQNADTVYVQEFTSKLWDGKEVKGKNIIASFNPSATDRVLLSAHWDSRLWADNDSDESKRKEPIIGANDGASGVGVLMEIARLMKDRKTKQGLDIILFDLEDQGCPTWAESDVEDQTDWCLGSQYWAENLHIPYYRAKYGILLDMVGGKNPRFSKDEVSMGYARSIVNNIWNIADDLGYGEIFVEGDYVSVMDDHVWINHSAKIPTIDIVQNSPNISFFPYWHTTKDDIDCIDKKSLEIVGKVVLVSFFASE